MAGAQLRRLSSSREAWQAGLSPMDSLIVWVTLGQVCSVPSMRPLVLKVKGGVCVCVCVYACGVHSLKESAFKVLSAHTPPAIRVVARPQWWHTPQLGLMEGWKMSLSAQ